MKYNRTIRILSLSLILSMIPSASYGKTPVGGPASAEITEAAEKGYTEEEWVAFNDNNLEYWEIQGLVHNFNPVITSAWNSLNTSTDSLEVMVNDIRSSERAMREYKNDAISQGDYTGIMNYTMQEMILNAAGKAMSKSLDSLTRDVSSTNRPLRQAEAQMVSGVQSIMIGYRSVMAQMATLEELISLYQESYNATAASLSLGLSTGTDLIQAQANLESARANYSALTATGEKLRRQLIVMCGWSESSDPLIGEIPSSDVTRIAGMNPEADLAKAIGNNYSLIEYRHTTYSRSPENTSVHLLSEEQMEARLKANLTALYQTVLADQIAYEAAQAGYQSALISKNAADTQYQLGMLSRAQYTGTKISYVQKKAAYEATDMTLFQDMETYDAAVAGNCSVE